MFPRLRPALLPLLLVAIGVAERVAFLPLRTSDTEHFLKPWLLAAERLGPAYLRQPFTNYAPFYEHCLALMALLPGPGLVRVKLFSCAGDVLLAAAVARLVPRERRWLAGAAVFALPTVAVNSALLGQSDAFYAIAIVAMLVAAERRRPVAAVLAFSVAIAIKLQALLAAPVLVLLWLERRQPAWTAALVPVAYVAFALPMLVAGRPLGAVGGVYGAQFGYFADLSANAPNLWQVGQKLIGYEHGLMVGLPGAVLVTGAAILLLWRRGTVREADGLLLAAAVMLVLVPFVTPKMHDRYFYLVDPVLVALACRDARWWRALACAEAASLLGYLPFVLDGYLMHDPVWGRAGSVAAATGLSYRALPLVGMVLMGAALALLARPVLTKRCREPNALAHDPI